MMVRFLFFITVLLTSASFAQEKTSGQGDWVFRYRADLSKLPAGADKHIRKAHGGFAVDRKRKGDVYFHLADYGIIHLNHDLKSIRRVPGDPTLSKGNGHNTVLSYDHAGVPYLVIPDNRRAKVLLTDTQGKILHELGKPEILDWFTGSRFVPTDALVVDGKLLIADGYGSKYVFPAQPFGNYTKGIYGGRQLFTTNHGLDSHPVTKEIAIADREASLIRYFNTNGAEIKAADGKAPKLTRLPAGAHPCDIEFLPDGTSVVGCLKGAGRTAGEIYMLDPTGKVLSVIKPKLELGLNSGATNFEHIHNASWTKVGDTFYLLVYAWNPGGFAVLERVSK